MKNLISNEMLAVMFNRLRGQENIPLGKLSSMLKAEDIFQILVNARYKQEHQIALSDLESKIKKESGSLISMYVNEKWNLIKKDISFSKIPFPKMSTMSLKDMEKHNSKKGSTINRFIA